MISRAECFALCAVCVCSQEWWVKGDLLREQYMQCLCVERGYRFVEVERTNQRGDGLACFVSPRLELVDSRCVHRIVDR